MSEVESQPAVETPVQGAPPRAALYVDGFNLYHPIRRMGAAFNYLKWACLWRLGENLAGQKGQRLVKVVFCTAVPSTRQGFDKRDRHIRFNQAQRARGVTILEGHYVPEPIEDNGIPTGQTKWTEKQTDLNVALELIMDGLDDVYDVALLLSADTDQVATQPESFVSGYARWAKPWLAFPRPTGKLHRDTANTGLLP